MGRRKLVEMAVNVSDRIDAHDTVCPGSPALVRLSRFACPGLPALVRRDGQVTELDGVRPVAFGVADGNYHVAIRHRNHLGCMTASPVALSGTAAVLDLTVPGTQTWGVEARKSIGAVRALWAGNTVADANLKYTGGSNDRDPILTEIGGVVPTATASGYTVNDVNMDGLVKYTGAGNDRDPILTNIGGVVPTNTRIQQLP